MNKGRFRLVYSQCLGMFVPVSETTKAQGRKSKGKRARSQYAIAAALFSISHSYSANAEPPPINALPTAGVISSGVGNINSSVTATAAAMTVNQSSKNMIINWGTFNIGSAASVNFIQPGATSAVLNRVGAGGGLSQIYGNLSANGQVYLINPNGILFGKGAAVNVNSLIASSLNITDDLFNNGILSSTDLAFPAAFSGTTGYIQVDAGASINAASGGRIMMFAPNIENNGLINTPDGQTLLAAGQKVYLSASSDPNLRGLLVEVDSGGTTTNIGNIVAERGNVTLAGVAVNQNGRVKATTSTTANGSIKLQASDTTTVFNNEKRVATVGGTVTLGENSTTEILPDATDKATVLDTVKVNKSKVDINAAKIHLKKNATIVAPSGNVNLVAGLNPNSPTIQNSDSTATANASRIYFDSGSSVDVSGVGSGSSATDRVGEATAKVSVASNVVEAELRSPQLADSPLQRDGILSKAKVYVDSRVKGVNGNVGTSVADVSGFTLQIKRGLSERLATGGSVKVQSEGDIVFSPTASINVSGGKVDYTADTVNKTRLQASSGQIYDIANAPKDLKYTAIVNVSVKEQGYTEGKDAGSVSFVAPAMVLEGKLKGDTVVGARQRTDVTRAKGATLQIGQNKVIERNGAEALLKQTYVLHSDLMLDASHSASAMPAFNDKLSLEQQQTLLLGTNFTAPTGFSSLLYYADGQITTKNGTNLSVAPGGNITLNGGGVDVQGNLTAHSGTIDLSAKNRSSYIGKLSTFTDNATGNVVVGSSSTLNVSGLWTNDSINPAATDAIALNGGEINISASGKGNEGAAGDVTLKKGSTLNASGGAWLNANSKLSSGKGGNIELLASDGSDNKDLFPHTGKLNLDGNLRADSLSEGGSLSLSSGTVTIGSTALGTTGETLIDPTLFQKGGFASYAIDGIDGLTVADNTIIAPAAQTRVLNRGFNLQQSSADIANFSRLEMLPATNALVTRKATNLSLSTSNDATGKLSIGLGSIISTDPGASVSLLGKRQLTVLGSILAPAGNISINSGGGEPVYRSDQTLWLGAKSVLDVSGVADSYTDVNGFKVGTVKDAGTIKLTATKGEVVGEAGAQLKLDGTRAVLDVKSGNTFTAKDVASKGGSLSISAREGILWDATMSAKGGSASVAAGSLSVTLPLLDVDVEKAKNDNIPNPKEQFPTGPREIVLKAAGIAVPTGLRPGDEINVANNGLATMFVDKLQNAGFENILFSKSNNIRIAENINLTTRGSLTLDTPNVIVNDGVKATLNSSYVAIGNGQATAQVNLNVDTPVVGTPVLGTGELTVNANYIDLYGKQSLSGIGTKDSSGVGGATFNSKGDIQLRGVLVGTDTKNTSLIGGLQTAGDLTLSARRVYPSTLSQYTLSSIGTDSTIAFKSSGVDTGVPFSVLGTLNVEAAKIKQDGVLRAPLGVINLEATEQLTLGNSSLTSVSAEGKTLLFGTTLNGQTWNFDAGDGRIATINTLPEKNINLDAKSVIVASGSKVDISGGGDLSAWEFTTGTGGSTDVLAAEGVFAVLPELKAGYMPGNSESNANNTKAGDSIYLSGGNGLAAGNYVLLPAHYALLPGAYSVKAVAGTKDFTAQQNTLNKDGSMLVSGYRTQHGGLTADSRSSGFLVASGNIARTQSEFSNTSADKFFSKTDSAGKVSNLRLPADAGRVAISAVTNLVLDGNIITKHANTARGAEVDISSDKIAISGNGSQEAGYLTVSSTRLNDIGAESLTIGGKRTNVAEGTQLNVTASDVKLIGGARLTGQEITLAATDSVSMANGTSIKATGTAVKSGGALIIGNADTAGSGDGALLRVSTGAQPDLIRKNVSQAKGALDIQTGAKVSADGSIIADATSANTVSGDITLAKDGAIRLGAPKISFGTPNAPVTGLQLDNSKLAALGSPSNIQLKSYSTIDFYGATNVGNADLKSLTLESAGLAGFNNAGNTVTLTADTVKFANPDGATFTPTGTLGTGTLQVNAGKEIGLGNGTFSTAGFSNVNLKADQMIGEAKGTLDVTGNLALDAGRITAASLSDQTIKASGNLVTSKKGVTTTLDNASLGGKLTLAADTITHGGIIDLPSGTATLKATGIAGVDSLILQAGSQVNAKGSAQLLGKVAGLADGGKVNLQTANGNLRMDAGAVVDVSATGGAGAGAVIIVSKGEAKLAGSFNGNAEAGNSVNAPKQGSFELTAGKLDSFSTLNTELERGQFNQSRNIHVTQGDITVTATDKVTAHNITLTTDDGNLTIAGKIDATGSKGGIVKLNAGQLAGGDKGNITLASTAVIDASATTAATETAGSKGDGGKVLLNTSSNSDTTPIGGSRISAANGSNINVSGKGAGSDGTVTLRAPRTGVASAASAGNGIAINEFKSTVIGANASIVAEGVKVYNNTGDALLDSAFIDNMKADNTAYLANASTIATGLGLASDNRFVVAAGDEVRSTGNITVANDIDLQAGGPGALTLRAKGDVDVNANISAGFTTADKKGELTDGGAWTYRIAAGADLNSADVLTTNNDGTGNFTLADGKLIRTGTGDIEIATGGNFNLATADSAIYTAGEADAKNYSNLGNFIDPTIITLAKYSVNGGDITLNTKGNVKGADSAQIPANWLFRQGRVDATTGLYSKNTSWWAFFRDFKQNIGALGGGDVNVNAGGEVNDLSAVIATNGRVFGTGPADGKLVQNGGGDLTVQAGGNVLGGLYMVDKGSATIRAGGGLLADDGGINTAFALGDGVIDVATFGQLDMSRVFNPTLTGLSRVNVRSANSDSSVFSTYGADSAVKLTSIASGVGITNQLLPTSNLATDVVGESLQLFPGTLKVSALGGDFTTQGQNFTLNSSPQGDLQLAASGNVNFNSTINMSDQDLTFLPTALSPVSAAIFSNQLKVALFTSPQNPIRYHAATPVHQTDSKPVLVYAGKDIVGTGSFSLFLPKKAEIFAGNDINNFSLFGQNLNAADVTTISAGHDYNVGVSGIEWGGPGYLDITAGRNIGLDTSEGIITRGNLNNPFLPEAGANLSILVGAAGADDKAFIAKYLDPAKSKLYSSSLTSFVKNVTGKSDTDSLSDADAWAQFQTLDTQLQHQFVQTAFYNELKQAGIENNAGVGAYKRGFDAIATLFPNDNYDGKLDLSFSQIKTERGGDLNVLAPGGSIVIGLPKTPQALLIGKGSSAGAGSLPVAEQIAASASKLGIFTVKGGDINLFAKGNIDVAQSREFTIAGGDILNWSTTGDIDAGKGSKTATSAPPPLIRTDESGNTIVDLSGVVSGSGIGTLQTLATAPVGNVFLIAPSGTVNAGDAGIRSSGNLLVAARRVIGADNIKVGGTSSGVPALTTVNISFNAPVSPDSNSANKQGEQLGGSEKFGENSKLANLLSLISVEVISLGDESAPADKSEKTTKKCEDEKNKKDCVP